MNLRRLVIEFVTVFAVALVSVALVTFLWNLIGHGERAVDQNLELLPRCWGSVQSISALRSLSS